MALNPVGPLPASTYWRRRAVVLIVVVLLLLLLRSCVGGGQHTPRPTGGTASPRATASATRTPATTPPTTAPVSTAPLCADSALTVTADTDSGTYVLPATPRITLSVKNTSTAACRRDLGAGAVELLVYSGSDRIWSSDDCNPSKATGVVTLAPGGSQAVVKTWPGKRSLPGCAGSKAAAEAGTYKVVSRVGTLTQDGAVFRLHS